MVRDRPIHAVEVTTDAFRPVLLFLHGASFSAQTLASPQMADLLVRLMPNADRVILKDAGHACYMREPTLFHEHVVAFCDRLFSWFLYDS